MGLMEIKSNMRCIETRIRKTFRLFHVLIKSNMRCIETQCNRSNQSCS